MRPRGTTGWAVVFAVSGTGVAGAQPRVLDVGAFVGVDHFGDDVELGNAWAPDQVPGTSALVGARLGMVLAGDLAPSSRLDPSIGAELEARVAMASTDSDVEADRRGYFSPVLGWRAQGVARFDWGRPFALHLVLGVGGETVVTGSPFMSDETDPLAYWGPGGTWKVSPDWRLRLDLRHGLTAGRSAAVVSTLELQVGLEHRFAIGGGGGGGGAPRGDGDGDGVVGGADRCPDDPEDADQVQDGDGCAERDGDQDGVDDDQDECRLDAEDRDGFLDGDGCPEPDNDGDGFFDRADTCPGGAEDKDGFQDEDGCPDDDNDGDGVADRADSCPDAAETSNRYLDDDGCPDEMPAALVELATLGGKVTFDKGKARLKSAGKAVLDRVAATLADHPAVRIRILGYTDEAKGDAARDLSRRRADAAKWYLVDAGVAADRIVIEGRGRDDAPGLPRSRLHIELDAPAAVPAATPDPDAATLPPP